MEYKKICKNPNCGKEFMGSRTQRYCSPKCRGNSGEEKPKKAPTVAEVAQEASEKGMSYGKYVAMQYIEERIKR